MQSFVRHVNPETRQIEFKDVPNKKDILQYFSKVKMDIIEAEILTGKSDIGEAAQVFEEWGCEETVITQSQVY